MNFDKLIYNLVQAFLTGYLPTVFEFGFLVKVQVSLVHANPMLTSSLFE